MAAKDIMNEHCYVAWSIFQPNTKPLGESALSRDCLERFCTPLLCFQYEHQNLCHYFDSKVCFMII